jgi:excisionase family DNA binding protein
MADLLTTKELQDLLKLDRTTIYRMLKDGRLTGIRVGGQWRFSRDEVDALVGNSSASPADSQALPSSYLPLHCIQPIQQVFAEIALVGALTTSADGEPLTEVSNSCSFCTMILGTPTGKQACLESWRRLAHQEDRKPRFVPCHAGLMYARGRIDFDGNTVAMVIAGQFYVSPADRDEEGRRLSTLAQAHGLDAKALAEASSSIRVLDERHEEQIGGWIQKVADTFEQVAHERAALMARLRNIAEMSTLPGS